MQTQVYFNQMISYQQDGTYQDVSQSKTFLPETESAQREADTSRRDKQMTNSAFKKTTTKQKKKQRAKNHEDWWLDCWHNIFVSLE